LDVVDGHTIRHHQVDLNAELRHQGAEFAAVVVVVETQRGKADDVNLRNVGSRVYASAPSCPPCCDRLRD
jgi:hypothetical protein